VVDDGSPHRRNFGHPAGLCHAVTLPARANARRSWPSARWALGSLRPSTPAWRQWGLEDFEYICKLDMDLELPARYFELLDGANGEQPAHRPLLPASLGSFTPHHGTLVPEICGDEMSVGHDQILSHHLLQRDRGFVRQVMWMASIATVAACLAGLAESRDWDPIRFIPPASAGCQPEGHLDWTGSRWIRPILMGTLAALLYGRSRINRLPAHPP